MARLREAVRVCPVPWPRRNRLLEAMGLALWRAIARGKVRTPEELAQLVRRLRAALWGEGLPQEVRTLHAWAGWKVREILRDLEWEKKASTTTEELLARIRRERKEAKRAWQEVRARTPVATFSQSQTVTEWPEEAGKEFEKVVK